jgi:mannose-6-phosphate isomerase-like protein (cupin superfamily)
MHVNVFDFSKLLAQSTERYLEFVRVSGFSVGIYVLDGGAMDHQKPHSEDEVYYVASGRAKMIIDSDRDSSSFDVSPGAIIFVPARVHHPSTTLRSGSHFSCSLAPARGRRFVLPRNDESPDWGCRPGADFRTNASPSCLSCSGRKMLRSSSI